MTRIGCMIEIELFLGFPIEEPFLSRLHLLDEQIVKLYTQNGDEYLRQVIYKDITYFGKSIGKMPDLDALDLLEGNIISLLKKLVPDFPYEKTPLILFPLATS